jgi:hypothetical protein
MTAMDATITPQHEEKMHFTAQHEYETQFFQFSPRGFTDAGECEWQLGCSFWLFILDETG